MARQTYRDDLRDLLARERAALQAQLEAETNEEISGESAGQSVWGQAETRRGRAPGAPLPSATSVTAQLGQRIAQIDQLRSWLETNPDLVGVVDTLIGNKVQAAERRQRVVSITLGIVSVLAGWLLSLVGSPTVLLQVLHR